MDVPPLRISRGVAVCSRCRERKPVGEFARNAAQPRGRESYCRPCRALINREGRARLVTTPGYRERENARVRDYRQRMLREDPTYRDRVNAYKREYKRRKRAEALGSAAPHEVQA